MSDFSNVIISVMEKLIDQSAKHSDQLSHIQFSQEEIRKETSSVSNIIKNNLPEDIKSFISSEIQKNQEEYSKKLEEISLKQKEVLEEIKEHRERNTNIDEIIKDIKKKGMYIRSFVAIIVALATIAGGIITISRVSGWGKQDDDAKQNNIQHQEEKQEETIDVGGEKISLRLEMRDGYDAI